MAKPYTAEEIHVLQQYPEVFKDVKPNRLTFTYQFRLKCWELFGSTIEVYDIQSYLKKITSKECVDILKHHAALSTLAQGIRRRGRPKGARNEKAGEALFDNEQLTVNDIHKLIDDGWYVLKTGGLSPTDKLMDLVSDISPDTDLWQTLEDAGIPPKQLGFIRYRYLQKKIRDLDKKKQSDHS